MASLGLSLSQSREGWEESTYSGPCSRWLPPGNARGAQLAPSRCGPAGQHGLAAGGTAQPGRASAWTWWERTEEREAKKKKKKFEEVEEEEKGNQKKTD